MLDRLNACHGLVGAGNPTDKHERADVMTAVAFVNDRGGLLVAFALNQYGQHTFEKAESVICKLARDHGHSCDYIPPTTELQPDVLALANAHPFLSLGMRVCYRIAVSAPRDISEALAAETTDVTAAGADDVRKALPIMVGCHLKALPKHTPSGHFTLVQGLLSKCSRPHILTRHLCSCRWCLNPSSPGRGHRRKSAWVDALRVWLRGADLCPSISLTLRQERR